MEYRTVAQTAELWQVSQRLVRRLLSQNRVPGAVRMANEWLIPADARKPEDGRKQKAAMPCPLFPPKTGESPWERRVLGLSGALESLDIGKARELAAVSPEEDCMLWETAWLLETGKLALYEGDNDRWDDVLRRLEEKKEENAVLAETFLRSLLGHPVRPTRLLQGLEFDTLHPDSLPFAWTSYLMLLCVNGQPERLVGAAEACCQLLSPCPAREWVYIRLLAAAGHQKLGNTGLSAQYFCEAVRRAAQEKLWSPFVELQNLLCGMLPELEKAAGESRFRLKSVWIAYSAGWMCIRGHTLRNHTTELLTPRELDAALLAASGDTNRVIGEKLGLSEATVKKYLEVVYQKLDVRSRNGLKYVLPTGEKITESQAPNHPENGYSKRR